jgi:protoporphyrinogen oxidase
VNAVSILGGGCAGLAAAHGLARADRSSVIYEQRDHWGGHTSSSVLDGFVFDEGPHVSFTKDERVRELFARGAGSFEVVNASISNWFRGSWIAHPAQVHLHGLDPDLVTSIITDFVAERAREPERVVENYGDWLNAMYGEKFAGTFPAAYTRKYWTLEPEELGVDWVGSRMYPPALEEVIRGAVAAENPGSFHYVSDYRYPREGGYQAFLRELAGGADVRTGRVVTAVDVGRKELRFSDGGAAAYDELVSSIPLDRLVAMIDGTPVPDEVRDAAERLLCTSVVLVDLGIARTDILDFDWFYIYDEDIIASRVHLPNRLSAQNVPAGTSSLQAEVYHSRRKPLGRSLPEVMETVIDDFIRMGVLRDRSEIVMRNVRNIEYANVVFDHQRQQALDLIKPWVGDLGIHLAGRFGEWGYLWSDDSINSGWAAAAAITGMDIEALLTGVLEGASPP